jgi:hypothetical protein
MKVFIPLLVLGAAVGAWGIGCSGEDQTPPPKKPPVVVKPIVKPMPEAVKPPEKEPESAPEREAAPAPGNRPASAPGNQPASAPGNQPAFAPEIMAPPKGMNRTGEVKAPPETPGADVQEKKVGIVDEPGTYVTKNRESLSEIAARKDVYGDPLDWPILYRTNLDKLADLDQTEDLPGLKLPEATRLKIVTPAEVSENLKRRADDFWVVNVLSTTSGKELITPAIKLIREGYPVYITSARVKGKDFQRLRVGFFKDQGEAETEGRKIMPLLKIAEFWPTKVAKSEHELFAGY